ncbi:MAG: uroporphyrinogen-III synthase [Chitinophagales bacterium]|nr:uroporphyrinogen-III synthase [Chitinophagales bacterium]
MTTTVRTASKSKNSFKKVKSILVSQPAPESKKSPYFDIEKQFKVKIDFRPFIQVEGISAKEFRKSKTNINDFSSLIFTSRNSIDNFFRLCEELRIKMPQDTKYFCSSEAIALYLQKYIQYRKRKVFYGSGPLAELKALLIKHKGDEKVLFPCTEKAKSDIPAFLADNDFDYSEGVVCKTVVADLSDLEKITYDMIVFFSPSGLKSLFENFPDFKQNNTRIAAFGRTTWEEAQARNLEVNVKAPDAESRSMAQAIVNYLKNSNGK